MKAWKKTVAAAAAALAALALAACGGSPAGDGGGSGASAPSQVVIGTQNLTNAECIALEEGYFQEMMPDAEVRVETFSAGRDLNQAMASGDIDFAIIGSLPVAIGLSSGIDYDVIYSTAILTNTEGLVAKEGSGIESLADLKGKRVATTFTSTCHYSLLSALKAEGIDPSEVDLIDLEPDKIVAAWGRGDIDAAYIWDPARTSCLNDGGKVVLSSGDVGEMGYPTADFALVRGEFAEQHPDYVVAYLKAMHKAEELFANSKAEALEVISRHTEMPVADIEALMTDDYVSSADQVGADYLGGGFAELLESMSEFLVEQGEVQKPLDKATAEAHVDGSFLEQAIA